MRALKRFVTVPVVVSICIALLWGVCAVGVAKIYPAASQSTSAYPLAAFSDNAFKLIHRLQLERAALAGYLLMNEDDRPTGRLKELAQSTDHRYDVLRRSSGRFNSDAYGPDMSAALQEAESLMAGLDDMRKRVARISVSAEEVVRYYTRIIEALSKPILQLESQPIDDVATDRSRKAYVRIAKANEVLSRDMAKGALFLGGQLEGKLRNGASRSVASVEKALLAEFRSLATAEQRNRFDAWSQSKLKAAAEKMRHTVGQYSDVQAAKMLYSANDWLAVFRKSMNGLYRIAFVQQEDFVGRVGGTAAGSATLFVMLTLVASLATLVAVAWFRPEHLRHGLLAVLLVANLALIGWAYTVGPEWLVEESGPIESIQAFVLAAAFFVFCANAANSTDAPRVVAVVFACACFLSFFREVDFRVYDSPGWLISISSGPGRRILFGIIAALVALYVFRQRKYLGDMIRPCLKWDAWPLLLALPLLVAADQIEVLARATRKDDLPGYWANGQFWEELLEFNAYLVLLFGAYVFGEIYGLRTRRDSEERLRSLRCALAAKGCRQS